MKIDSIGRILIIIVVLMTAFSCTTIRFDYKTDEEVRKAINNVYTERADGTYRFPEARFLVFSDPHLYDVSLGVEGEAFRSYLAEDRKLLRESEPVLRAALSSMKKYPADFVLVPGDLTKDGERINHELFAEYCGLIEEAGVEVLVVPGNHDMLNPHAYRFSGEETVPVESVTPEDFERIYGRFGYADALSRDPASLSYVAEPVPGLWVLALDSAVYEHNLEHDKPETDGRFSIEQLSWIEEMLIESLKQRKTVIVMHHHGIIPHYATQEKHFGEYVLDRHEKVAELFAAYGANLVFTGHYHAQDIVEKRFETRSGNRFLFDIETGSLVTYPNPYRYITMNSEGKVTVTSGFVQSVPALPEHMLAGRSFTEYAKQFVFEGIEGIAVDTMEGLGIKEEEASTLAPQIADAFVAHYRGDEQFPGAREEMLRTKGLSLMGSLVVANRKDLVYSLWDDPPPPDNNLIINLRDGSWVTP